jgi:hypothetical protein
MGEVLAAPVAVDEVLEVAPVREEPVVEVTEPRDVVEHVEVIEPAEPIEEPAEPEQPEEAPRPRRARRAKAEVADEVAEPVAEPVAEVAEADAPAKDAPAEAVVARKGLGAVLAERWAARNQARSEQRQREALAREHIEAEHELAREAAGRLPVGASRQELRDMVETIRGERAATEAAKAEEVKRTEGLAEASRLEAEASAFDQAIDTQLAPDYRKYSALYEQASNVAATARQGMDRLISARDEYLDRARSLREQAAALRAQYTAPEAE